MRILKWVGAILGALLVLIAGGWLSYPLWDGFGAWRQLPETAAPIEQRLSDPSFQSAAEHALSAIAEHREVHGFPGISAAVAVDGTLVWSGSAGWADLHEMRPVTPDTVFRIGSTSKAVTSTALARLVDAGEIDIDTPISAYIDDLPNPVWEEFTPRQLGSHMTGLPEYSRNSDLRGALVTLCGCRHYPTVRDSFAIFDDAELLFPPETDFHYTSFDVNLLGATLAARRDQAYLDLLQDEIAAPLGLAVLGGDHDGEIRPELTRFYESDGERAREWRPFDLSQRWPGGGLVSTSSDLVRIGGAWLDESYISAQTREALWEPQRLNTGETNPQSYAIGWRFNPDAPHPAGDERTAAYAHHGGVSKGAMSWLVVYPEYGLSVAVNINTRADTFRTFASVEDEISAAFMAVLDEASAD